MTTTRKVSLRQTRGGVARGTGECLAAPVPASLLFEHQLVDSASKSPFF